MSSLLETKSSSRAGSPLELEAFSGREVCSWDRECSLEISNPREERVLM